MKGEKSKECKGCLMITSCTILATKIGIGTKHALDVVAELHNCPCNQCLVKSMCLNPCDEYAEFSDKIQNIMIYGANK